LFVYCAKCKKKYLEQNENVDQKTFSFVLGIFHISLYNKPMEKLRLKNSNFIESFWCAFKGVLFGMKERNMHTHLFFFVCAAMFGFFLKIPAAEWMIVFLVSGVVFALELVNTAIEEVCNRLRDDLGLDYFATQKARDVAAGAVLVASWAAVACGLVIFVPKLWNFIGSYLSF